MLRVSSGMDDSESRKKYARTRGMDRCWWSTNLWLAEGAALEDWLGK